MKTIVAEMRSTIIRFPITKQIVAKKKNVIIGGLMIKTFAIILIILISAPLVGAYKVFPNPPPSISPQSSTVGADGAQNTQQGSSGPVYISKSEDHYFSQLDYGDKIEIRKFINPNNKDYCLLNRIYCLSTEIKGTKWTENNLLIKDYVESPLIIINLSEPPHIINPFEGNSTPIAKSDYRISNNILRIYIKDLMPNCRIKYSYEFISNETGVSESNTIVRIGNHSTVTDLDYSKEIQIGYPQFDVNVDLDRLDVHDDDLFLHDPLHITYNLLYKSANWMDPILCNISFENSQLSEYDIFLNETELYDGQLLRVNLNPANYTPIDIYVRYKNTGPHRIPGILVDGRPYIFDYEISVTHRIIYWTEKLYPLASIIALIVTIILARKDLKTTKEQLGETFARSKDKIYYRFTTRKSRCQFLTSHKSRKHKSKP